MRLILPICMRIAVNTRFLLPEYLEGYGYFIFETFKNLTNEHPEHEFIFIFDRPFDKRFVFSSNIIPVVAGPPARHPLLWKYWYDFKLRAVLKKYKADVFVSADGFCSLTTMVPQCIVVHDLAFLHYPAQIKKSHLFFFRKYIPRYLQKASTIATVSQFSKQDIQRNYQIPASKIDVVYNASKEIFQPSSMEIIKATKEKYSAGTEYFVYVGAIHPRKNLVNLLKAFSIFKKRLKSNFKLIIAGRLAWKYESFVRDLKKYKYRDDVILTGYLNEEELVKLMSSAYALVYPSLFEGFGVPVLEAMKCNVAVVTSSGTSMEEIAKDAALYFDPRNVDDIAEKMMVIYKNEDLKKSLVEKGEQVARQYSWRQTSERLWKCILKAVD